MGRATGYSCDEVSCTVFQVHDGAGLPSEWITVQLPATASDRQEDRTKVFHTERCVEKFMQARRQSKEPEKANQLGTITNPVLTAWLSDLGYRGKSAGSRVATHNRYHDMHDDECPVCAWQACHPEESVMVVGTRNRGATGD